MLLRKHLGPVGGASGPGAGNDRPLRGLFSRSTVLEIGVSSTRFRLAIPCSPPFPHSAPSRRLTGSCKPSAHWTCRARWPRPLCAANSLSCAPDRKNRAGARISTLCSRSVRDRIGPPACRPASTGHQRHGGSHSHQPRTRPAARRRTCRRGGARGELQQPRIRPRRRGTRPKTAPATSNTTSPSSAARKAATVVNNCAAALILMLRYFVRREGPQGGRHLARRTRPDRRRLSRAGNPRSERRAPA